MRDYYKAQYEQMLSALQRALIEIDHACDNDNSINENGNIGDAIRIIQNSITEAKR